MLPEGAFDTRVPGTALNTKVEDELVWADEPKALKKKRARKGFIIDDHCLKEKADSILKFFESYICEHVVEQQFAGKAVR